MKIPNDLQSNFERYCKNCEGTVPPQDSADWNRLAGAFLTYNAHAHPPFNVRGTQTGRFSTEEPNS